MPVLSSSVGLNGRNERHNVLAVQGLLRAKGVDPGPADGICGSKTIAAIRRFQAGFMARPDGLVSPGGPTWQRLCAAGAVAATSHATASQWTGDSSQWPQEKKLLSMTPPLRPKVSAVLAALQAGGFEPRIFFGWRSVAVQLQLYKAGRSKVRFSFHNAQLPDGTPNAYAADIIDRRYAWTDQAESSGFWKALGAAAKGEGLYWGGDWKSFRDWAHVQLVDNNELARVKRESGL